MPSLELKIPPLALTAVTLGLIVALAWFFPAANLAIPGHRVVAAVLAGVGLVCLIGAARQFRRAETTLNPFAPEHTATLVITGLYRYTRNPMYLGMALLLAAAAAWFASVPGLLLVAVFCAYLTRFQIEPEERAMAARFGAQYAAYRARVRRWA